MTQKFMNKFKLTMKLFNNKLQKNKFSNQMNNKIKNNKFDNNSLIFIVFLIIHFFLKKTRNSLITFQKYL